MRNVPENELFSAYLDGELTAAEQAEMERLLASSPAARQLLEELRSLSSTLQSLPALKLDEDLSQQVLCMAEQRMLSGQTEPGPVLPDLVPSTGRWQSLARRLSRPRVWIWPALAASAALLLAVLFPGPGTRVAPRPAKTDLALAPAAPHPGPTEEPSIGPAAPAAIKSVSEKREMDAFGRDGRSLAEKPASMPHRRAMVRKDALADSSQPPAAPVDTLSAPAPPAAAPMPMAGQAAAVAAGEVAKSTEANRPSEVAVRPMKGAKEGPESGWRFTKERLKEGRGDVAEKSADEVLFVRCDVTAESLANGAFRQVLTRRQIQPVEAPADERVAFERVAGDVSIVEKKSKAGPEASQTELLAKPSGSLGRIVYLYARATPAQVEGVLADLNAQPSVVASQPRVSVMARSAGYGAFGLSFSGKAGAGMDKADPDASPREEMQNVQNLRNLQNQPSLAESAAGEVPGNLMQNAQSRSRAAGAIGGNEAPDQSQVSRSRAASGMRQQKEGERETRRRGDAETRREGDAETKDRQLGQKAAGGEMAGVGGGMADRKEAQAKQQVVFVLRVLDAEPIAAEESVRAKSGQAKAAAVDAARVAPVEAKPSEPAKQ